MYMYAAVYHNNFRSQWWELICSLLLFIITSFFVCLIKVKYSAKYSLESVTTKDVGQNRSVVLSSLNPFTLYVINVSAFTSKGEGSHASVEQLTDEGRKYMCIPVLNGIIFLTALSSTL